MAYKKSRPIIAGTKTHSRAIKNLSLNRSGNGNMPDGRSKSSPFQLRSPFRVEGDKWVQGETTTDKKVTQINKDIQQVDTTSTTPKTRVTDYVNDPDVCKKGSALWKEAQREGMSCKEWMKVKTERRDKGEDVEKMMECTCKGKPYKATDCNDPAQWPPECQEKPEEKKCSCKTPKGQEIEYPCGEPEPKECSQQEDEPCYCVDTTTGEKVTLDCGKTNAGTPRKGGSRIGSAYEDILPERCKKGSKILEYCNGMTLDEYRAKRKECEKKGSMLSRAVKKRWYFDTKTCECKEKDSSTREGLENLADNVKDSAKKCFQVERNNSGTFKNVCVKGNGIKTSFNR